jgi:tryptophan synthase alpha chain
MKSIRQTITDKGQNVLNIYFTAGHPALDSTVEIITSLAQNGADLIELGIPYSDPLADGLTIQKSGETALKNGQTIANIFLQVQEARKTTDIPIVMMGYFNQFLQYGAEKFLKDAQESGVQGLILPDLPMDIYQNEYQSLFEKYQMEVSFLITPLTSDDRIYLADQLSSGFLYIVSQSSITGKSGDLSDTQRQYFQRIQDMKLSCPQLIGFGIHDKKSRMEASQYAHGVIVGSAFIRALEGIGNVKETVQGFMESLKIN